VREREQERKSFEGLREVYGGCVQYRVPDNWGVLLNERRDHYFASHPVEHALVEVLELWEKLRGHTIEAMTRRCGEGADYVELIQVASPHIYSQCACCEPNMLVLPEATTWQWWLLLFIALLIDLWLI
jgi:hypothetical protein